MNTKRTIFSLITALTVIGVTMNAAAQKRDRDNDHDSNRSNGREQRSHDNRNRDDHHDHDKKYSHHDKKDHHHHDHDRRRDVHVHYHDRYCGHAPVVVHHHYKRPRYIYYRDYDVYYDFQRNAYISFTGKNWMMTAAIPMTMRHVNVRTVRSYEVDYYNDDIPRYLERGRPACGREFTSW